MGYSLCGKKVHTRNQEISSTLQPQNHQETNCLAQALQHKLALEAQRVSELEGLLSGLRTSHFKSSFSEQHSADKAGSLQARNTLLTQQASL